MSCAPYQIRISFCSTEELILQSFVHVTLSGQDGLGRCPYD